MPDVRLNLWFCRCFFVAGGPWVRPSPGIPCALLFQRANLPTELGRQTRCEIAAPCTTQDKKIMISMLDGEFWCARRDSNPHDFTHCHLKAARLPIPPRAQRETGTRSAGPDQRRRCNKSMPGRQDPRAPQYPGFYWFFCLACHRAVFGNICLTSTAIRLRSTSTTPLATGKLLASTLTSSASVASSSMMAPRDRRRTWWIGHGGGAEDDHQVDGHFIEC